jgi:drug/metabolite transporter (DMT)-like permease
LSPTVLGSLIALAGALVWGGGDFAGGLATRDRGPFQVLLIASATGWALMLCALALRGEPLPDARSAMWSAAAGISGALGIAALYRGLATGAAAEVAPTAAVIGAAFPVLLGTVLHGSPGVDKWIGVASGFVGIWLVAGGRAASGGSGLGLAIAAGLGFGGFFVLIAQAGEGRVFGPLVVSKAVSILLAGAIVLTGGRHEAAGPGPGLAILAGALDAAGNVFYLAAAQLMRFEIAAVLASMSPAVVVLLAAFISRQAVKRRQRAGIAFCLVGIAFLIV